MGRRDGLVDEGRGGGRGIDGRIEVRGVEGVGFSEGDLGRSGGGQEVRGRGRPRYQRHQGSRVGVRMDPWR